ncbi:MAG TPA: tRNA 2-thiouridine(34) synthase MnmA [Hyphomonadaceae bacterium]|nr:tRNA 2-thiouridine(34) synthase MnmA [Hyphomonadaceae bacterium]HPN04589.1 tRNA 2-thiouridine(34) synthase MnmA [Hyphomonadaceae bacterium]
MTTLIGPRGGPAVPASVDADLSVADGLCDFSKLEKVDLSGADLDLFPGDPRPRSEIRVVAAMSGGVDSSVVAALLKYAGYDVVGVTLQLYDHGAALKKSGACCAGQDIHDARRVAEALGIPHYVLDYESRFRSQVMEDFADTYLKGSTPIPCVRCNQTVKFKDLLATAKDLGADAMATGHYIRRSLDADGVAQLTRAADPDRDQSYFLFATTREQLDFLRFPLGGMKKPDVRRAAAALGLQVAAKPDSQDICFVPAGKYSDIVQKLRPGAVEGGEIVHMDGRVMGRHDGVIRYTIGQRRGLGIATGDPLFVTKLDAPNKRVIIGPREALLTRALAIGESNWLGEGSLLDACAAGMPALARVRSTRAPVAGRMTLVDGVPGFAFDVAEEGVAPGQACVLYAAPDGASVLGGGFITATVSAAD